MAKEPKCPLKVVRTELNAKNKIAAYAKIIMKDANNNLWEMNAATFLFDLKEYQEQKHDRN